MKHILLSGATGTVGRFVAARLIEDGHKVTAVGRKPLDVAGVEFFKWDLAVESFKLPRADALVHCAFSHVSGKYRDGEGDDPHTFIELNVGGALRVFEAAKEAGVSHAVFMSSNAVYADTGNWAVLKETAELGPDSLYGQVKIAGEMALENLCDETFTGTSLRLADLYGCPPGRSSHAWSGLFSAYARGAKIESRLNTVVHGEDVASAVAAVLENGNSDQKSFDVFNVSDLLLDWQDLISLYSKQVGSRLPPPPRAPGPLGVMETGKLKVVGWMPGGQGKLEEFVASLGNNEQDLAELG